MGRANTAEDYLETIYLLDSPLAEYGPLVRGGSVQAARVAEILGVTPPTASEMLTRLEGEGLIVRGPRRGPVLTDRGRRQAERVVRRHRVVERFLTDLLDYEPVVAHERAERIAAGFDDDEVERLADLLGRPECCPHGWPLDPCQEQAENLELAPLSIARAPSAATVVRLAEHDPDLLAWLFEQGFVPGAPLLVEESSEPAAQLTVHLDGRVRVIGFAAAGAVFVRFGACLTIGGGPLEGIVVRGRAPSALA